MPVLESGVPLSRSFLWRLQRAWFERQGIGAWRSGTVPHYVTSNPFIADAYARVVAAWIRGLGAGNRAPEPVTLVELGAGPGRFAFHFLRRLAELRADEGPDARSLRYVMTDLVGATVDTWRAHPAFAPWAAAGVLDFATFDVEEADGLDVVEARRRLGLEGGPLVVVANYFFDGLPQDVFRAADGRLHLGLARVSAWEDEVDLDDPALFERLHLDFAYAPLDSPAWYGDPDLDLLLDDYRRRLDGAAFRFPIAALRACRLLERLADGRLLLLSADKGCLDAEALPEWGPPRMVAHGSFSMGVDYHAVAEHFRRRGGHVLAPPGRSAGLVVAGFQLGGDDGGAAARAFADAVGRFGPDDFFVLKQALEALGDRLTLPQALAWLRLAHHDARVLRHCLPALQRHAPGATPGERRDVRDAAVRACDAWLPIGEAYDFAFDVGVLLAEYGFPEDALPCFERSLELHGPDAHVAFNAALCAYRLGRPREALAWVERTLAIDPEHVDALDMRRALRPGM